MKNIKKMLCVLFAIMTVMTSISTMNAQAKNVKRPQATQVVKVYAAKNGMRVKWQVVNKVSGYQIQTARSKDFKKEKKTYTVAKPKASAKTLNDFKAKKTYYVRARAYKKTGKKKVYSKWSNVKRFKSPNFMEIDGNVYLVCSTNDNHQCVCGNVGRWFNSRKEFVKYVEDEKTYWSDKYYNGQISFEEKTSKTPSKYNCWSCGLCGKWTGDIFYEVLNSSDNSSGIINSPSNFPSDAPSKKTVYFYSSLNLAAQDINQTTMGTKNTVADLETAENAVCGVYRMDDTYRIELYKDLTEQESVTLDQNSALNLNEHTISFKKGAYLTYNKNLSVYNGGFNSTDAEYIIYGSETNKDSAFNIKNVNVNEITSQNITSVAFYNFSNSVNIDGLNILQSGAGSTGCIAVGIITKNNDKTSTANIKNYNFKCELSNSKNIKGIQSVSENILIKDTNINIETSSSYAGSGIHVKPAHLSIINTNVHFGTDGKTGAGARIFSNESTEQTTKIENCNFFGTAWGLVTSPVGTTEIKNSKFSATDHSGYIEGNADIYDSEFFIANRDKYTDIDSPFGLYFGSPNADGKAVANLTRCKIGNGEERAFNTVAAKRNKGYKSPLDVNFYDCELYYGTAAIFSYNTTTADNIGNTRFNLYGKTKIFNRNGTPISKSTITKLIAKWKQTPVLRDNGNYFTNILGNFLVSGGVANVDENTGEIKAIYLTDDANVYDYRD